jgi:hypothetical protein
MPQKSEPIIIFHGTFEGHLASILKHGLDPSIATKNRNFSRSRAVIYLSKSKIGSVIFPKSYITVGKKDVKNLGKVAVLRIDERKLDKHKFKPDHILCAPDDRSPNFIEYNGIIPPSNIIDYELIHNLDMYCAENIVDQFVISG